jgi:hypothetical protein
VTASDDDQASRCGPTSRLLRARAIVAASGFTTRRATRWAEPPNSDQRLPRRGGGWDAPAPPPHALPPAGGDWADRHGPLRRSRVPQRHCSGRFTCVDQVFRGGIELRTPRSGVRLQMARRSSYGNAVAGAGTLAFRANAVANAAAKALAPRPRQAPQSDSGDSSLSRDGEATTPARPALRLHSSRSSAV